MCSAKSASVHNRIITGGASVPASRPREFSLSNAEQPHYFGIVNQPENSNLPKRQNPSSGVHVHLVKSNLVFLTISTEKRVTWLANDATHRLLVGVWSSATAWLVGDYLLMPDHLHLFCAPQDLHYGLEAWIAYWKRLFTIQHGRKDWKLQSRGWHHRLRDGESYSQKWLYVQENPVRKGLVKRMEDWRFKGRVFDLIWSGD